MADEEPSGSGRMNFSAQEETRAGCVFVSSTNPFSLSLYK